MILVTSRLWRIIVWHSHANECFQTQSSVIMQYLCYFCKLWNKQSEHATINCAIPRFNKFPIMDTVTCSMHARIVRPEVQILYLHYYTVSHSSECWVYEMHDSPLDLCWYFDCCGNLTPINTECKSEHLWVLFGNILIQNGIQKSTSSQIKISGAPVNIAPAWWSVAPSGNLVQSSYLFFSSLYWFHLMYTYHK